MDIDKDNAELQNYMAFAKATSIDLIGGDFYRVIKNNNEVCWQYITRDKSTVYLAYFHILSAQNLPFRRAHMVGLDPDANYKLQADGNHYGGDSLMQSGIGMPYVSTAQSHAKARYMPKGDFSSYLFVFEKTDIAPSQ